MKTAFASTITALTLLWFATGPAHPAFGQAEKNRGEVMQPPDAAAMAILFAPTGDDVDKKKDEDQKIKADLGQHLLPGPRTLGFRSLKFTFAYQDQPDNIVDVTGEGDAQMIRVRPTPESRLRQLGITLSPARWFRSASDYKSAYDLAAGKSTRSYVDAEGCAQKAPAPSQSCERWKDPLNRFNGDGEKLDFLAWTAGDRLIRRAALGLSVQYAENDRQRDPGDPESPSGTDGTWTFKFDPDALSVFPGDLSAAYAALLAHTSVSPKNKALLKDTGKDCASSDHPIECLNTLTGRQIKGRWVAALVPSFEWKRESQFDYRNVNGTFINSPDVEDTLDTFTLTWDLGATLDTAKHRRDAISAIAIHEQLVEQAKMRDDTTVEIDGDPIIHYVAGEVVYHTYAAGLQDKQGQPISGAAFTWSGFVGTGDKGAPLSTLGLTLASDGALVGKPGSRDYDKTITIVAEDGFKNKGIFKVTLLPPEEDSGSGREG